MRPPGLLLDRRDRALVAASLLPAGAVAVWPAWWVVAVAVWWTGNTVAHEATHRRTFRGAFAEGAWSLWLSLLLGVPQRFWRARHLAHHAGAATDLRATWSAAWGPGLCREVAVLLAGIAGAFAAAPGFAATALLPGVAAGLALGWWHGVAEHRGGTTSCHARWWNLVFRNDGYHVEHHAFPALPSRELPSHRLPAARTSPWPPVLRWIEDLYPARLLCRLERLPMRWPWLRRAVLAAHRRALANVLRGTPAPRRIVIVGGGLFPRSALLLRERFADAELVVLDREPAHLEAAARWLPPRVQRRAAEFAPGQALDADLVVLPLALCGDRERALAEPPAERVLVHDWLWRRRRGARSAVVAWWLLKRISLIEATPCGALVPA